MKNLLLFALLIVLTGSTPMPPSSTYDLSTAIENGWITASFSGNDESPHYYQPVTVTLSNSTGKPLTIRVLNGQTLTSNNPELQDIVVTQEELIAVGANRKVTKPLFAMCIQRSNGGGNDGEQYQLGAITNGNLSALTQEIAKRKAFNTLGQYAVWALTDDSDIRHISGIDQDEATYFKQYVANLLDVPVPEDDPDDYLTNYDESYVIHRTVGGRFKYGFSKPSAVTIGMFDDRDIIVRELYNNPNTEPGTHELSYEFDAEVYTNEVYYIRLIIDGQIKVNFKMKPRGS
jgi:hypothetical protein